MPLVEVGPARSTGNPERETYGPPSVGDEAAMSEFAFAFTFTLFAMNDNKGAGDGGIDAETEAALKF